MLIEPDYFKLSLVELHEHFKKRLLSPVEVVETLFNRIEEYAHYNSYITVCKAEARSAAKVAEEKFKTDSEHDLLLGIPLGLKDLIYTKGIRTTCGSGVFKDFIPDEDAEIFKKLKNKGFILIGKQNTHEFAYGTTGDDSYFGPSRNPYDASRITGGSSGGSANATALGLCWGAIGTDTSGSVRIPAALCGVVGMKPTFGKINNKGIYPLSWSMDHVGPITKTVEDNAVIYDALTDRSIAEKLIETPASDVKGIKIGLPITYFYENIHPEIRGEIENLIQLLTCLGAEITEVDAIVPEIDESMQISAALDRSEAYIINREIVHDDTNLLGEETRKRILQGADYRAFEYILAQQLKEKLIKKYKEVFKTVDLLLTPTVPILPTKIGQEEIILEDKVMNIREALMKFTFIANYIGIPSISLPCGVSNEGFPIAVQLMGSWEQEETLYTVANTIERNLDLGESLNVG